MAKEAAPTSPKLRFRARASFVRLDKPKPFEEGADPRWETTFLLDPADKAHSTANPALKLVGIKEILQEAANLSKQAYGVVPLKLRILAAQLGYGKTPDVANEKDDEIEIAFYKGDKKEYDGFAGMFVIPAHNKIKPAVANRKGAPVEPGEHQFPYGGAQVIGSITLWAQVGQTQKKYGKRIGVNLRGVQFYADDKAFGAGEIAAEDEFDAMEDDDATAAATAGGDSDFD